MFISEQCVRDHGGISRVASARLRATEVRADPPRVTCRLGVGLSRLCRAHTLAPVMWLCIGSGPRDVYAVRTRRSLYVLRAVFHFKKQI
jgi:hypothetical protein